MPKNILIEDDKELREAMAAIKAIIARQRLGPYDRGDLHDLMSEAQYLVERLEKKYE